MGRCACEGLFDQLPDDGQISRFTNVLLETLDGYVACRRSINKPWAGSQVSICEAVRVVGNNLLGEDSITPEGSAISNEPIFTVENPRVYATVSSDPESMLAADCCVVTLPNASTIQLGPDIPPIRFKTTSGHHKFASGGIEKDDFAVPPVLEVSLP